MYKDRMKQAISDALYSYRMRVREGELWKATAAMAEFRQVLGKADFKQGFWSDMETQLMEDADEAYLRLLNSKLGPDDKVKEEDGSEPDMSEVEMPHLWRRK